MLLVDVVGTGTLAVAATSAATSVDLVIVVAVVVVDSGFLMTVDCGFIVKTGASCSRYHRNNTIDTRGSC